MGGLCPVSCPSGLTLLPTVAMETFCEMVQFYLKHLEDSVYPMMTEEQFATKVFPMYRYFVTVWLRNHNPEVRPPSFQRGPAFPCQAMAPHSAGLGGRTHPERQ